MNELSLLQKVWNYAHVLRGQGVPDQAYISQISYLVFLKMGEEPASAMLARLRHKGALSRSSPARRVHCRRIQVC
jgi:hypothetical protein